MSRSKGSFTMKSCGVTNIIKGGSKSLYIKCLFRIHALSPVSSSLSLSVERETKHPLGAVLGLNESYNRSKRKAMINKPHQKDQI